MILNTRYCINLDESNVYRVLLYSYKWKDNVEYLNGMHSEGWIGNTRSVIRVKVEWKDGPVEYLHAGSNSRSAIVIAPRITWSRTRMSTTD